MSEINGSKSLMGNIMNINLIPFLSLPIELQIETRHWRNSDNVTRFFKIKEISYATHLAWLDSLKEVPPKNIAWVISYDSIFIGATYFHSIDYIRKSCDWGIYIYKDDFQNRGIGKIVLTKSIEQAKNMKFKTIFLDVMDTNIRAITLYKKFGFFLCSTGSDSFSRYQKNL